MTYPINQQTNPYKLQQQQSPAMGLNVEHDKNSRSFEKINVDSNQVKEVAVEKTRKTWLGRISEGLAKQDLTIGKAIICALGTIGVVFGASGAMNHFIRKGGMFKMGKFFDDFAGKLLQNKTISSITNKLSNGVGAIKASFAKTDLGKLFAEKTNLLKPKNQWAAFMSKGTKGEAIDEVTDALKAIVTGNAPKSQKRSIFGFIGNAIDSVKNKFPGAQKVQEQTGTNLTKLKALLKELPSVKGKTETVDDLLEQILKVDDGGLDNKIALYRKVEPALKKYFGYDIKDKSKLIEYLSKGQQGERFVQNVNIMGMTHNVDLGEAVKKVMILHGETAQTGLGKVSQMATLRAIEGVSNGVTSRSKMGLIFGLGIYWGIMKKVVNAPKKEKAKTAVDELVQDMGGYMMMPVTAGVLYGAASLKNWGVSSEKIAKFNKDAAELSTKYINAGDKTARKAAKTAYKALKKEVYSQGKWYQKLLRWPATILSTGLTPAPKKGLSKFLNTKGGGALRFWAFMFVISPLLMKPIIKTSRAIFGKTTEVKKEEAELMAQKNKQHPDLVFPEYGQNQTQLPQATVQSQVPIAIEQPQPVVQQQVVQPQPQSVIMQSVQPSLNTQYHTAPEQKQNLINMYTPSTTAKEMIPTEKPTTRRYIPSSEGVKVHAETYSAEELKAKALIEKSKKAAKIGNKFVSEKDKINLDE